MMPPLLDTNLETKYPEDLLPEALVPPTPIRSRRQ
jgi:hypothetical protein